MKNLASVVLLCSLFFACAHRDYAADAKSDPSQFPLVVHILASAYLPVAININPPIIPQVEIVTAAINGKHYQLQCDSGSSTRIGLVHAHGLLNLGDYPAKLLIDEHKTSYESYQQFEVLLPDGSTRRFVVVAQSE